MLVRYSVHVCAHCTDIHMLCGMTSSLVGYFRLYGGDMHIMHRLQLLKGDVIFGHL